MEATRGTLHARYPDLPDIPATTLPPGAPPPLGGKLLCGYCWRLGISAEFDSVEEHLEHLCKCHGKRKIESSNFEGDVL